MKGPADIERIVRTYHPNGDERSHALALDLLDGENDTWPRTNFSPGHFTASGFVVSPDGESVLLILHGKLNRWLQPGGHMEADDVSAEAAARREIFEETGVGDLRSLSDGPLRIDVHEIPARGDEPTHLHFDLGFGFQATRSEIGPLDEVVDARWIKVEHFDDYDGDAAWLSGAASALRLASGSAA